MDNRHAVRTVQNVISSSFLSSLEQISYRMQWDNLLQNSLMSRHCRQEMSMWDLAIGFLDPIQACLDVVEPDPTSEFRPSSQ